MTWMPEFPQFDVKSLAIIFLSVFCPLLCVLIFWDSSSVCRLFHLTICPSKVSSFSLFHSSFLCLPLTELYQSTCLLLHRLIILLNPVCYWYSFLHFRVPLPHFICSILQFQNLCFGGFFLWSLFQSSCLVYCFCHFVIVCVFF